MNQTITMEWMPDKRSTDALKGKGYSNKQLNHIRRCFIRRNLNQEIANASRLYSNMVKASGAGEDIKHVKPKSEVEKEKKRELDLSNKPEDASERAVEAKKVDGDKMSNEDALAFYNRRNNLENDK